jgi:hypothetical protein
MPPQHSEHLRGYFEVPPGDSVTLAKNVKSPI